MQIKDLKVKEVQTIQVLIKSVNVAKNAAQKSYLRLNLLIKRVLFSQINGVLNQKK